MTMLATKWYVGLVQDLLRRRGGYAIYPPRESLAEVKARLNFPKEDKPHNLRVDVVDPASTTDITSKSS